ncbi:MAG: N-acetylneuraminate synthase [Fretibacterium sp.]|nr:N-acetylneuraminate synthase [Fretibacterium sp.]
MGICIIAEAGVNHNGDVNTARRLVDVARAAGANCVKFQTFRAKNLASCGAGRAAYQKVTVGEGSQQDMLRRLELSYKEFAELKEYCVQAGIQFLSTPFDLESIDFLISMDMPFWKIPSGEITNLPYLLRIARTGKPVVLSTGMSTLEEVSAAMEVLKKDGSGPVTLLHCNTEYPTPMKDVNLRAMLTLRDTFHCEVGYSDHTLGIDIPIAAAALGAIIIEKHFTLDRNMEGPDHKASLEPEGLTAMVRGIRNVELALGTGVKEPSESEEKNIAIARKSIVALRNIRKGEVFTGENITVKRPGNGVSPMRWFEVLGTQAVRDFQEDELISL